MMMTRAHPLTMKVMVVAIRMPRDTDRGGGWICSLTRKRLLDTTMALSSTTAWIVA